MESGPAPARYQSLDAGEIAATADLLCSRIEARFPGRGLGRVAGEVVNAIRAAGADADRLEAPARAVRWFSRALVVALIAMVVAAAAVALDDAASDAGQLKAFDWLTITESAVNDIVFAALAVFFFWSLEGRRKRNLALGSLHRIRSLAHVIDMHQLSKDPERALGALPATVASEESDLTPDELGRYLDYCNELLSMVAKAAALYAQASSEPVVLDTVSEIETLASGLSREIWQKISLLHTRPLPAPGP